MNRCVDTLVSRYPSWPLTIRELELGWRQRHIIVAGGSLGHTVSLLQLILCIEGFE